MFAQFLGNYLVKKKLITEEQFAEASEQQKDVHMKLGVLAVNEEFMTPEQAQEVHDIQTRVDKRFGQIAIELDYLTEEQLDQLLNAQPKAHLVLAQVLIDKNFITLEKFSQAMQEYKKTYGLTDEEFVAIQSGNIELLINNVLNVRDYSDDDFLTEYISLFSKNVIRFIEGQISLDIKPLPKDYKAEWAVYQKIKGEFEMNTFIVTNEEVFLKVASKYAEEEIDTPGELAQASVGEFLNLQNGIFLVNMSYQGVKLNMDYQTSHHNVSIENLSGAGYVASVKLPNGHFDVIVVENQPDIKKM